jgi:predicted enzyme related to lactoylglutathione lyase
MFSHISFTSLPVDDFDRAMAFYDDMLGLNMTVDAPFGDQRWIMFEIPGARTQIHLDKRPQGQGPGDRPALVLIAGDIALVFDRLRDKGVVIMTEPKAAEWDAGTTYGLIRDSEDNIVLIASR